MLEWYRRNATYRDIAEDMEGLFGNVVKVEKVEGGVRFERLTVREAYRKFAGWDPWTDWDQDRFDFDMAEKIEPNLPEGPVFLIDYPPQACSLARVREERDARGETVRVAERWELYWRGIELANCFTELCDGGEQRRRFIAARAERRRLGESDYPLDEEFLDLLPLVGSAAGVALGIDRLVMLLCGEKNIASVMTADAPRNMV